MEEWVHRSKVMMGGQNADIGRWAGSRYLVSECPISPLSVHPGKGGVVCKGIVQRTARSIAPNSATPAPAASHMNGTQTVTGAGLYTYASPMTATLIGYARCSTDRQDLAAVRQADTLVVPKLDAWPGPSRTPAPSPTSFSNEA